MVAHDRLPVASGAIAVVGLLLMPTDAVTDVSDIITDVSDIVTDYDWWCR